MTPEAFRLSLANAAPPAELSLPLQGLWWDAKGDWTRAHACAQDSDTPDGNALHAYLHRKEDDLPNARYWYARAGRKLPNLKLDAEWSALASELLAKSAA